jgi:DNA ligase 1
LIASKKRPRQLGSLAASDTKSQTPKIKEDSEEEDSDDEPVLKRPKRNYTKNEPKKSEIPPSNKKAKKQPDTEAQKSKSMPPLKRSVKVEEEEVDVDDTNLALAKSEERLTSAADEAASEVDEVAEEDEEDEKPEVIAKAREKVQKTLQSNSKDPYPDWKPGEPVPYAALCTTFSLIEMTTKRLVIAAHCSLFLRQVLRLTPEDLLPTVLLMINKLAADYEGIELGIGESLIMKAIGETTGRSLQVIKQDQKEIGDLGLVAVKSKSKQPTMFKPKPLTVKGVHKGLIDIATTTGSGAQGRKVDGIKKLLSAADGHMSGNVDINKDKGGASEAKFIVRFLEGKLRLGLAEKTVLTSLAQAMVCHEIESKGKGKIPTTEQMAEGEAILKSVHR